MAESPKTVLEPIYKYPHVNLTHRSKATNMWIGISVTLTFILVVGVILYCYVKGRQQRQRQRQQRQRQRQRQEIHLVEIAAALPRAIYHAAGDENQLECSICLEEYQDEEELVELPGCGHFFHPECIESALRARRECPFCRAQLDG